MYLAMYLEYSIKADKLNTFLPRLLLLLLVLAGNAFAHAPRENYVWVNIEDDHVSGHFEISIDDLKQKLNVDVDQSADGRAAGIELQAATVQQYLSENFSLSDKDGELPFQFTTTGVSPLVDTFAQYHFKTDRLPASKDLTIENTIFMTPEFAKEDRLHRSLILIEHNKTIDTEFGEESPFLVFSPRNSVATLDTESPAPILQWREFLWQGILHIWFGFDHVIFVIALLLTTVLMVQGREWVPIQNFKSACFKTLKIITLFTIAHSITLSMAAYDLVSFNSALVETIIAISIIVVALNNIFSRFNSHAWFWVFLFGLFHGLGFASVMADLQFRAINLSKILVMFNIGVEIGQVAIVLVVFPLLFLIRKSQYYRTLVVIPLSILAILLAGFWVMERTGLIDYVT